MKKITVKKARGWGKILGLMLKQKPYALFFKTRFGIHTFGLLFPIDVVILDSSMKVVHIKKSLSPNKIFFWHPQYDNVLELPEHTIGKNHVRVGEKIELDFT